MMEYPEVVCMRDQMREHLIGKRIALGYLTIPADPGDRFEIEVLGEPVQATVRKLPFYDPENARLKG